jgi:hypothetical protein
MVGRPEKLKKAPNRFAHPDDAPSRDISSDYRKPMNRMSAQKNDNAVLRLECFADFVFLG